MLAEWTSEILSLSIEGAACDASLCVPLWTKSASPSQADMTAKWVVECLSSILPWAAAYQSDCRISLNHPWGMKGILFLTAPILPTFVASFGRCIKMLMVPCSVLCGTRTRKLSAIA